ncbi:unnamed protein product [Enterobius vermicularis]|uniref:Secreted protein n=1 Tax=Enterobius vermicularis TaxID=51028 RepID=A0A0N4VQZ3_ENTVE|nr:unnamed protein product [Enterobius vermicularis]
MIRLFAILLVLSCRSALVNSADDIIPSEDLKELKELTSKIGDKIVNLTKQQITDLGTVMKQQESVLECKGKQ